MREKSSSGLSCVIRRVMVGTNSKHKRKLVLKYTFRLRWLQNVVSRNGMYLSGVVKACCYPNVAMKPQWTPAITVCILNGDSQRLALEGAVRKECLGVGR